MKTNTRGFRCADRVGFRRYLTASNGVTAIIAIVLIAGALSLGHQLTRPYVVYDQNGDIDHVNEITLTGIRQMDPIPTRIPPGWNAHGR